MIQNRKETACKKNRKFGDIHGGRMRLKCADGIFERQHNLAPPTPDQRKANIYCRKPFKRFLFSYS